MRKLDADDDVEEPLVLLLLLLGGVAAERRVLLLGRLPLGDLLLLRLLGGSNSNMSTKCLNRT